MSLMLSVLYALIVVSVFSRIVSMNIGAIFLQKLLMKVEEFLLALELWMADRK